MGLLRTIKFIAACAFFVELEAYLIGKNAVFDAFCPVFCTGAGRRCYFSYAAVPRVGLGPTTPP
jgi:hypothetical protein